MYLEKIFLEIFLVVGNGAEVGSAVAVQEAATCV